MSSHSKRRIESRHGIKATVEAERILVEVRR